MYMSPYPACRQTDFIDVANPLSEQMHQYRADHSTVTEVVDGRFEGDLLHYGCRDVGRKHKGGDVHFTVAIDPQNEGVRIRRRIDQSVGRQIAQVYADGVYVARGITPMKTRICAGMTRILIYTQTLRGKKQTPHSVETRCRRLPRTIHRFSL